MSGTFPAGTPNAASPVCDPATGLLTPVWFRFLTALWLRTGGGGGMSATSSAAPATLTLAASPFVYTAPYRGVLLLSGGGVVRLTIQRGAVTTIVGQPYGAVPLLGGDVASITWAPIPPVAVFQPL